MDVGLKLDILLGQHVGPKHNASQYQGKVKNIKSVHFGFRLKDFHRYKNVYKAKGDLKSDALNVQSEHTSIGSATSCGKTQCLLEPGSGIPTCDQHRTNTDNPKGWLSVTTSVNHCESMTHFITLWVEQGCTDLNFAISQNHQDVVPATTNSNKCKIGLSNVSESFWSVLPETVVLASVYLGIFGPWACAHLCNLGGSANSKQMLPLMGTNKIRILTGTKNKTEFYDKLHQVTNEYPVNGIFVEETHQWKNMKKLIESLWSLHVWRRFIELQILGLDVGPAPQARPKEKQSVSWSNRHLDMSAASLITSSVRLKMAKRQDPRYVKLVSRSLWSLFGSASGG